MAIKYTDGAAISYDVWSAKVRMWADAPVAGPAAWAKYDIEWWESISYPTTNKKSNQYKLSSVHHAPWFKEEEIDQASGGVVMAGGAPKPVLFKPQSYIRNLGFDTLGQETFLMWIVNDVDKPTAAGGIKRYWNITLSFRVLVGTTYTKKVSTKTNIMVEKL